METSEMVNQSNGFVGAPQSGAIVFAPTGAVSTQRFVGAFRRGVGCINRPTLTANTTSTKLGNNDGFSFRALDVIA